MPALLLALAIQIRSPRADAEGIVAALTTAFRAKDRAWFEGHLAKGFAYRNLEGETESRAAMLGRLDRWFHPLAYRVEPSLALVSARRKGSTLTIVGDLKVRSQPIRPWRTPVTVTTMRVDSSWRSSNGVWTVIRIVERRTTKTVDGVAVP